MIASDSESSGGDREQLLQLLSALSTFTDLDSLRTTTVYAVDLSGTALARGWQTDLSSSFATKLTRAFVAAYLMSSQASEFLMAVKTTPACDETKIPRWFRFHLCIIIALKNWERRRLKDYLGPDLPTSDDLIRHLEHLVRTDDLITDFLPVGSPTWLVMSALDRRVTSFWDVNEAEFIVGDFNEEALVEAVAQLVWQHRHN